MSDPVTEYLSRIGRKGGSARVPKGFSALTPEQRAAMGEARIKCRCGTCSTCKAREYGRLRRARQKGMA